jgi:hypothetical protein
MSELKKCIKLLIENDTISIIRNDVAIIDDIPADKLDDVLADIEKMAKEANKKLDDYLDDLAKHGNQSYKALNMWKVFKYDDLLKVPPIKKPCFLAGTLVRTVNGLQPIEQIQIGDLVHAYNFDIQKVEHKPVTELFVSSCDKYVEIYTSTDIIKATGAHRFWIPAKNKWVKARELSTSMSFQDSAGKSIDILDLKIVDKIEKTYNFEVEDLHNYYVGKDQVLSHNKSIKDSIFASTDIIEVKFYKILDPQVQPIYVGQTIQDFDTRFAQHRRDPKKTSWVDKMRGVFEIELTDGKPGTYKMTPYEAAVTELYEINHNKGTTKSMEVFKNKSKPIGRRKFEYFKKHGSFNPCIFYA